MTNADKYLRENVDIHKLSKEIISFMNGVVEEKYIGMIEDFFNCPVKPTLSEDEKVILRNIRTSLTTIGRKLGGALYLGDERGIDSTFEDFFTGIFEWIQIGEEYSIKELLEDD